MKIRIVVSTVVLASLLIVPAHAEGGRVGNGGFAYVCRDPRGVITDARLLDLWEAEGVPTWRSEDSIDGQLTRALNRLKGFSPNSWIAVEEHLDELRSSATYSNRALTKTEDAFPPYQPEPGCGYEQVARYEPVVSETGKSGLRISSEIFNSPHFSNTDRAALFFHEAVYFVDREINQATNSQRTRIVVAHLFSDSKIPNSVRLATAATLVGEKRWVDNLDPKEKVRREIIAVADPTRIRFETQFSRIDGIDRENLDRMNDDQKSSDYRCTVTSVVVIGKTRKDTTGWVKLSDLVNAYVYDSSAKVVRIHGEIRALEFVKESGVSEDVRVANNAWLTCEKRDSTGNVTPVEFSQAVFHLLDGESLYVLDDGSIQTSPAETPIEEVDSANDPNSLPRFRGVFHYEIVRGI